MANQGKVETTDCLAGLKEGSDLLTASYHQLSTLAVAFKMTGNDHAFAELAGIALQVMKGRDLLQGAYDSLSAEALRFSRETAGGLLAATPHGAFTEEKT